MPRKRHNRTATAALKTSQAEPVPPPVEDLLIEQIRQAFAGVTLGAGIGLWQADAIDDYGDEGEQSEARKRDELYDWSRIPTADLGFSNLCFVDADGMRFLLPAYMVDFVQRRVARHHRSDAALYAVTSMTDYTRSQFTSLDARQRAAVAAFLRWYLRNEEASGGGDVEAITRALRDYWESTE